MGIVEEIVDGISKVMLVGESISKQYLKQRINIFIRYSIRSIRHIICFLKEKPATATANIKTCNITINHL